MARQGFSRGDRLVLVAILSAGGAAVAAYLTYEWYNAFHSSVCDVNSYFSCSAVGKSTYAAIGGIPTATIGLAGFLSLLILAVAAFRGVAKLGPWTVDGWILLLSFLGGLVGTGLSFLEVLVINAVCLLCAIGFGLDLAVLGTAVSLRRMASGSVAVAG